MLNLRKEQDGKNQTALNSNEKIRVLPRVLRESGSRLYSLVQEKISRRVLIKGMFSGVLLMFAGCGPKSESTPTPEPKKKPWEDWEKLTENKTQTTVMTFPNDQEVVLFFDPESLPFFELDNIHIDPSFYRIVQTLAKPGTTEGLELLSGPGFSPDRDFPLTGFIVFDTNPDGQEIVIPGEDIKNYDWGKTATTWIMQPPPHRTVIDVRQVFAEYFQITQSGLTHSNQDTFLSKYSYEQITSPGERALFTFYVALFTEVCQALVNTHFTSDEVMNNLAAESFCNGIGYAVASAQFDIPYEEYHRSALRKESWSGEYTASLAVVDEETYQKFAQILIKK